jgi:DNA-binding transcriptional MerR regulator/methylmalonyl-CoA mutase cobalamin-binding subunit
MVEQPERETARHPIGVVSSRTGLPQDVLRAWERRYAAVTPHRTDTGRRLYSDRDLEKLSLLKRAVDSGRRISDVASLTIEALQVLVHEDSAATPTPRARTGAAGGRAAAGYVEEALEAIEALDGATLESLLRQASVDLAQPVLRNDVIRPLLEAVGDRWRAGTMRIANEHLATAALRSFLGALRLNGRGTESGPTLIVATPPGQRHELGALLVATAALEVGWDSVYLGPDLPAAEIASAVRQRGARAVALSLVCPARDPRVADELRELRDYVGEDVEVFAGGAAAESYAETLVEIGALRMDDTLEFQGALEAL